MKTFISIILAGICAQVPKMIEPISPMVEVSIFLATLFLLLAVRVENLEKARKKRDPIGVTI